MDLLEETRRVIETFFLNYKLVTNIREVRRLDELSWVNVDTILFIEFENDFDKLDIET